MVPSTGWLSVAENTKQDVERAPLPVPHEISYGDGAQGTYEPQEEPFIFGTRVLVTGVLTIEADAGFIGNDYGFLLLLQQHDAYGVLLLDTIDPPDITQEVEAPIDVETDKELCPSNDEIDAFEACCSVLTYWIFDGSVQFNGTRTFGALP